MFGDSIFHPVLNVFRVVSVSWVVRRDWHDPSSQQVVVPIEDVVCAVSKHPDQCIDSDRVTCNAHRRLLIRLFGLCEFRCYRDFCAGGDDCTIETVVVLLGGWVVVPRGSVVVLDRFNVVESMEYVESSRPRTAACSTSLSKTSSMMCSRSVRKRSTVSMDGVCRVHSNTRQGHSEVLA